jgi:hypothetical protein
LGIRRRPRWSRASALLLSGFSAESWAAFAAAYLLALERTYERYQQTGRKLVVANFANVILGVVEPTARLLMCEISLCGGGRCSFVADTYGDLSPLSEFIGLAKLQGTTCSPVGWRGPLPVNLNLPPRVQSRRKVAPITCIPGTSGGFRRLARGTMTGPIRAMPRCPQDDPSLGRPITEPVSLFEPSRRVMEVAPPTGTHAA